MPKRSTIALMSLFAASAGLLAAPAVSASVTFTFEDPSGAREFRYNEGDIQTPCTIGYDSPQSCGVLRLTVDASEHGLAPVTFDAILEIDLIVGSATDLGFGSVAGVSGVFRFLEIGRGLPNLIFEGVITDGAFVVIGSTGAQVSSSDENSLTLTAGPALQGYLDLAGLTLAGQMDAAFSLSSIRLAGGIEGVPGINEHGFIESFSSNAAYVGSAGVVPSPPAAITLATLVLLTPRRRRPAA
jgi:hypothetical protein